MSFLLRIDQIRVFPLFVEQELEVSDHDRRVGHIWIDFAAFVHVIQIQKSKVLEKGLKRIIHFRLGFFHYHSFFHHPLKSKILFQAIGLLNAFLDLLKWLWQNAILGETKDRKHFIHLRDREIKRDHLLNQINYLLREILSLQAVLTIRDWH